MVESDLVGKNSIKIENTIIQYGITPVRDLLNAGYTISDFEQIIEEPTLATCNLNKANQTIAILSFFNLKEKVAIEQLTDVAIDLVLLHETKKSTKKKALSSRQALRRRVLWTFLIHFFAAALFFCVYALPAFFSWVQKTQFRAMAGGMPMGMLFLILPAIMITFIWGGFDIKQKPITSKILLSLFLILNVMISLTYLVVIDQYMGQP